jgi:hypothetical protein
MHGWRSYSRYQLKETAKNYLQEHKKLDSHYLQKTHNLLQTFLAK